MRVVVIGATGNVGTSLLQALSRDERVDSILGIARRRPGLAFPRTDWAEADVTSTDLRPHLLGADVVVHLAWAIQPSRDLRTLSEVNVEGSARVFRAAGEAGVPALVYASSVGAYSPGPKDRYVDESWPAGGIDSSFYARHKAEVERRLDGFERERPAVRVVRVRPGLIFKREAAEGIRRLFAGPLFPSPLARPGALPIFPDVPRLRFQGVHSLDVGEAYRLAAVGEARGAFNVAAEPVLDSAELARLLRARLVPVPARVLRAATALSWRLRLQPTPAGWLDLALSVPLLDTTRARTELGWQPRHSASEAFCELLAGMRDRAEADTPPLSRRTSGRFRSREFLSGVGGRGI